MKIYREEYEEETRQLNREIEACREEVVKIKKKLREEKKKIEELEAKNKYYKKRANQ